MPSQVDEGFYERADAHIHLSNEQLAIADGRGKVSASMMYGTSRFNAWITACSFASAEQMADARAEIVEYFCEQYRLMLEENVDDYIKNFAKYMGSAGEGGG